MTNTVQEAPILGVDIGGSKLAVGLISKTGRLLHKKHCALRQGLNASQLFDRIFQLIDSLMSHQPIGIGVTIPGLADIERGLWVYAPYSGLENIPVRETLQEYTKLPVLIDNDVNVCALGERQFGVCRHTDHFLWITVSTGIGGGLVFDDKIYRGPGGHAGEIGHMVVEEKDPLRSTKSV